MCCQKIEMTIGYPCKSSYFQAILMVHLKVSDDRICDIKLLLWFCSVNHFFLCANSSSTKVGFVQIMLTNEHGKLWKLMDTLILKWWALSFHGNQGTWRGWGYFRTWRCLLTSRWTGHRGCEDKTVRQEIMYLSTLNLVYSRLCTTGTILQGLNSCVQARSPKHGLVFSSFLRALCHVSPRGWYRLIMYLARSWMPSV